MWFFKNSWLDQVEKIIKLFFASSCTELVIIRRFSLFSYKRLKITKPAAGQPKKILATREGLFIPFNYKYFKIYKAGNPLGVIQHDLILDSQEHFETLRLPYRCLVIDINEQGVVVTGQVVATIKPV